MFWIVEKENRFPFAFWLIPRHWCNGGFGHSPIKARTCLAFINLSYHMETWPWQKPWHCEPWKLHCDGCKKDVTRMLKHWSYVFLALTHRFYVWYVCLNMQWCMVKTVVNVHIHAIGLIYIKAWASSLFIVLHWFSSFLSACRKWNRSHSRW